MKTLLRALFTPIVVWGLPNLNSLGEINWRRRMAIALFRESLCEPHGKQGSQVSNGKYWLVSSCDLYGLAVAVTPAVWRSVSRQLSHLTLTPPTSPPVISLDCKSSRKERAGERPVVTSPATGSFSFWTSRHEMCAAWTENTMKKAGNEILKSVLPQHSPHHMRVMIEILSIIVYCPLWSIGIINTISVRTR